MDFLIMDFFLSLAAITLCLTAAISLEVAVGLRRMTRLDQVKPHGGQNPPKVSIVVPACNEAATIEPALLTMQALDYADLEIIAVNDRSTDATGEVLARLEETYSRLRVYTVTSLPDGWLGKNHALQLGAEQAGGDYLLFTDADIIMEKTALSRAMHHVLSEGLDHLCVFFDNQADGGLLNALFVDIGGGLLHLFKPWLAKDPKSKRFMGVGAFNLVKASSYREIQGHRTIAMHPIDDVMLGKVLKRSGFRQDCLLSHGLISVKWYATVRGLIDGLMKNSFAACDYRLSRVAAGVLALFLLNILPLWALVLTNGLTAALFGASVCVRILSFADGCRRAGLNPLFSFWSIATPYLAIYVLVKATWTTLRKNGIEWRGTFYPLQKLKDGAMRIRG